MPADKKSTARLYARRRRRRMVRGGDVGGVSQSSACADDADILSPGEGSSDHPGDLSAGGRQGMRSVGSEGASRARGCARLRGNLRGKVRGGSRREWVDRRRGGAPRVGHGDRTSSVGHRQSGARRTRGISAPRLGFRFFREFLRPAGKPSRRPNTKRGRKGDDDRVVDDGKSHCPSNWSGASVARLIRIGIGGGGATR